MDGSFVLPFGSKFYVAAPKRGRTTLLLYRARKIPIRNLVGRALLLVAV